MRLDQYEWSRNPRGLHVKNALITPLPVSRWAETQMGWAKLVDSAGEYVDDAATFLSMGITPIVRLYEPRFGANPFNARMRERMDAHINVGSKWFELYNEPNLGIEWPGGVNIDWRNVDGIIRPMMDNWLVWAEYTISRGCYPGFIALAEATPDALAATRWMEAFLNYLEENHRGRMTAVLANGAYCATHPYILNHFYQELPGGGPASVRPPEQQNAREGGWHFEYPYDPFQQQNDPGRTVQGGTELTPHGDPVGLTAMGRLFNQLCAERFGSQAVPVVGTEGGVWPLPINGPQRPDTRYPPYDSNSHPHATVAMFEWSARQAPPWFFGVSVWKEDEYFEQLPATVNLLREIPPVYKNVPPIEVMGSGYERYLDSPEVIPVRPGPGPVHGEADFHMVILAPGLETRWFFDTAQAYWNTFRPIVTTRTDYIQFFTQEQSLAITVITPPELIDEMTEAIRVPFPQVWFDLIVADDQANVAEIFNSRVRDGLRFG